MEANVKEINQQGIVLARNGNLTMAADKFAHVIEVDPMCFDGYKNLGVINLQMGNYSDAKAYLKKALLIKKDGEAYFQYGNACYLNEESEEGLEYYNMALSAGYDGPEALFILGKAYEDINNGMMALRFYQKAIIKDPICADYQIRKIQILLRMNKYEDAEKAADRLLETNSELYEAYHIKSLILQSMKRNEEAVAFAKMATEKFPEDTDLLIDYVNSLSLSGKLDLAQKILIDARKMKYYEPAHPKFLIMEVELKIQMGDTDAAIALCDECISTYNDSDNSIKAQYIKMNLTVMKQDYGTAIELAERLAEQEESKAVYFAALYYRGLCSEKLGMVEEAKKRYKEAISIYRMWSLAHPSAVDVYIYRAMCLKELGEYEEALKQLEYIEAINDSIAEIHLLKAEIYKSTNRNHLVKIELQKVQTFNPNYDITMFNEEE